MDEHWHPTHGYELLPQGITDGWVMGQDNVGSQSDTGTICGCHRLELYVGYPKRAWTPLNSTQSTANLSS